MPIEDYCNQTLTLLVPTETADAYGQPQFAAGVSVRCRHEPRVGQVRNPQGEMVLSSGRVFVPAATVVQPNAQVQVGSSVYRVLFVDTAQGLNSTSHLILTLGG